MKLTTQLLNRAAQLAAKKSRIQRQLTEAFVERYGVTYSEIDNDSLIDTLDYHGGVISLAECDRLMTEAGHPPKRAEK